MKSAADLPIRRLLTVIGGMAALMGCSILGYMHAGWSFGDAFYMVLLTVYTVGYGEVHHIDTPYLHAVTIITIILGCTGMILVTGFLVQVLTASQVQQLLGGDRMKTEIARLKDHVIVCGFGRIGQMVARDLALAGDSFLVIDHDEPRLAEARALGYVCLTGDATDEDALRAAGVERARILATVLPSDAANVFITLSARSLNSALQIIARGEAPSTESKLLQAGANQVVLPAHIGAERIAEMVLFPETTHFVRGSERMREVEKTMRDLGLDVKVIDVSPGSAVVGQTIEQVEARALGAFFVVQVDRAHGEVVPRPPIDMKLEAGDGVLMIGRVGGRAKAIFSTPASRPRAGRTTY